MSDSTSIWPLANAPHPGARITVASQGRRIWSAEYRLESFGEVIRLAGADHPTQQNLKRQHRVAFTIADGDVQMQGSGMARFDDSTGEIILEPYRISDNSGTFELKLKGWTKVTEAPAPDIGTYAFWYQAFRLVTIRLSALPVLVGAAAAFALGQLTLFCWHWLSSGRSPPMPGPTPWPTISTSRTAST